MEEYVAKLLEDEANELKKMKDDRLLNEKALKNALELQQSMKTMQELRKDEEILTEKLEKLRRENFELQACINAWQSTLEKKLKEFQDAETELNDMYASIWREREKFCTDAEGFGNQFAKWWKNQLAFVADLEKLGEKRTEHRTRSADIEVLELEVRDRRNEIDELLQLQQTNVVVHRTENEEINLKRREDDCFCLEENNPFKFKPSTATKPEKRVKFASDEFEKIEVIERMEIDNTDSTDSDLFPMMDLDKMRMVKKIKNRAKTKIL